jgi:sporulation protein YlmC with PRC-barrel domain
MWWKKSGREEKEKIVAYLRSKLFPWNFILEEVEEEAVAHYAPFAIQMCAAKGIERDVVDREAVKDVIRHEVKEAVEDYLFDPEDREMVRMHGRFAPLYPFAFSQAMAYAILHRLGLQLADIVDVKAVGDLLGLDEREISKRELLARDAFAKNGGKAMKMFARSIVAKKVITAGGDHIGSVEDLIFTGGTGKVEELVVNHLGGTGLKESRIPMRDVRLNMYSKNIVLKPSNYHETKHGKGK